MNLANLGKAALLAAQNRLQTAGHNINNAATEGYNRQSVLVQTASPSATGAGWIGRGVQAVSVQRAYDNFLSRQMMDSQVKGAALQTYGNQISQVNNLFADRTVGIAPAIQKFFDGIDAVATAPADSAARQELLGRSSGLATQIRNANAFLDEQRNNINTQITTTITQVNSYLDRINDLNQQITTAKATQPGQPPNDLLDMRDQAVSELGQMIDVKAFYQDDRVSIAIGNGQVVLSGNTVFPLTARPAEADPSRMAVNFTILDGSGQLIPVEMPESLITGGKLGGLLTFRADSLDVVQNDLGRIAMGLALAMNEAHQAGADLGGLQGGAFFKFGPPNVLNHESNTGTVAPTVGYVSSARDTNIPPDPTTTWRPMDPTQPYNPTSNPWDPKTSPSNTLTNQDYRVEFSGGQYSVTTIPGGTKTALGSTFPVRFGGVTFDPGAGVPVEGDSWMIQPTRNAAANLDVAITDPAKIAAASYDATIGTASGVANGDNALIMAKLRTDKTLGNGSASLNEAFSQIISNVGVQTQQNTTSQKAQNALIQQNYSAQQAVSGVNLNEESMNLDRYQEQFRAASRMIDVSSTLFDTLLGLRN
ncbi:flagellar hook-associated protein FlgK [Alcaligenaceae bacterium CGII-47]|nr:flagellar hook-associated protein FlgK [Alcaligenaceae bacterium CGII-47]